MRLSRFRTVVLLLAVLHVGSGVVSAFAACCDKDVHQGKERLMECCLKGGPNHICPFMSKSKRSKAPGRVNAACPMGHDDGVPVTGFASAPLDSVAVASPEVVTARWEAIEESAIVRFAYPPNPPPKF
jgi:hypothetical protein